MDGAVGVKYPVLPRLIITAPEILSVGDPDHVQPEAETGPTGPDHFHNGVEEMVRCLSSLW